ncbi:hypothetical protein [Dickeya fangzhongdai]|uniref:Uncharacterized protein n=1 Tax=Dickeya fangzhongdai TaxID=1778540 RepID=A0A2K8QRP9_9GAMM|nr:hypothetical protein [Dickeya fangzhongdai]ATZ96164.1 hypothetical protein CVE23_20615 [Dickeya fangzhongdai]QOH49608.1 hypothetical protein DYD82_20695 [Dickeya fangzhongdai]QOH53912.1 hypothetical protein DYD83_20695 [Dickeya fangzhongdai]UMB76521.1 hypothetical protein FXN80_21055 [Dickeya fangzhongdai]WOX98877.1 hypothetical protein OGM22_14590 [Dickeya fangzhongdai]
MSEAMVSESIVESEWILKGFWTRVRFAYQTTHGGWSDIDVLAYDPEEKHLVISESKVRGPKKDIYAYTEHTKQRYGSILEYDANHYFSFLDHLPLVCADGVIFSNFNKMVKRLTVQLVSNYVIDSSLLAEAEQTVLEKVHRLFPDTNMQIHIMLDSTIDVISRVISLESESTRGRRYGHPMLDIAREINRYSHPTIHYAGQGKVKTAAVREQINSVLESVLNKKTSQ